MLTHWWSNERDELCLCAGLYALPYIYQSFSTPLFHPLLLGELEEEVTSWGGYHTWRRMVHGNALHPFCLIHHWLSNWIDALPSPVPGGHISQGAGLYLRRWRTFLKCLSVWWVLVCWGPAMFSVQFCLVFGIHMVINSWPQSMKPIG